MNANVYKKNANDPTAAGLRAQKPDEQKGAVEGPSFGQGTRKQKRGGRTRQKRASEEQESHCGRFHRRASGRNPRIKHN